MSWQMRGDNSLWPRSTCLVNEGQAVSLQDRIPTVPLWPQGAGIEEYYQPSETDWPDLWEHTLWVEATLIFPCYMILTLLSPLLEKVDMALSFSHTGQLFAGLLLSTKKLTAPWVSCVHWGQLSCVNHSTWTWPLPPGCQEEEAGHLLPFGALAPPERVGRSFRYYLSQRVCAVGGNS